MRPCRYVFIHVSPLIQGGGESPKAHPSSYMMARVMCQSNTPARYRTPALFGIGLLCVQQTVLTCACSCCRQFISCQAILPALIREKLYSTGTVLGAPHCNHRPPRRWKLINKHEFGIKLVCAKLTCSTHFLRRRQNPQFPPFPREESVGL